MDIPSFSVKAGDVVSVRARQREEPGDPPRDGGGQGARDSRSGSSFDAEKVAGRVVSLPTREQINLPVQEQLIVELYSK